MVPQLRHAVPQAADRLVNPQAVICLGERAYGTVPAAYALPPARNWRAAVEGTGITLPSGPVAFAVYHCGQRILNTHRNRATQTEDWKRIGAAMATLATR